MSDISGDTPIDDHVEQEITIEAVVSEAAPESTGNSFQSIPLSKMAVPLKKSQNLTIPLIAAISTALIIIIIVPLAILPDYITLTQFTGFTCQEDVWDAEQITKTSSLFNLEKITYKGLSFDADFSGVRTYAFNALSTAL